MNVLRNRLNEIKQYPTAVAGMALIAALILLSIYTLIAIPYGEAIRLWRGGENVWQESPRNASPVWLNWLPGRNLPTTLILDSSTQPESKTAVEIADGLYQVNIVFPFEFHFDGFPKELTLFLTSRFDELRPYVNLRWHTPDGRTIALQDLTPRASETYRISQDARLQRNLGGRAPHVGLFAAAGSDGSQPVKGTYRLEIEALLFEPDATIDAKFISYGQVHGWAGTDHRRRDLMVALLWGTPIALAFGFLAAVGATITTMVIAAVGVWYGKWVDALIQRITEVNLILPVLPILIMVGTFYSRSIWIMLGVIIALGVFSAGIKTYRAIFLQVKESPYIEAAKAYGAGSLRIVFRYMIPRVIPVLIPQFVVLIPSYVFLEASLAVLGLGDPILPTWGKVLNDAYVDGALYKGYYYWVLTPSVLLMVTGLGFAMVGFALDRIFNPRLRGL